jgi:isochorismate hydrolase
MKSSVNSILSLQEYALQKKMTFIYENDCLECEFFKRSLLMCVWGEKLKFIGQFNKCPLKN